MPTKAALITSLIALLLAASLPASAMDPEMTVKESQRPVKETLDALAKALEAQGIKVVARVDHAAGAKAAGMELRPAELIIFGNPKLGTPLMQADPRVGIDLPMKALAWTDANGRTWLGYTKPEVIKARYKIEGRDEVFKTMAGALDKLTDAAIAAK